MKKRNTQGDSRNRPSRSSMKRIVKRGAVIGAMAGVLAFGGKLAHPAIRSAAEQEVARQEKTIKENLRHSDLFNARIKFKEWKGLREMDEIVYDLAKTFQSREKEYEKFLKSGEKRGALMEKSPQMIDDELARKSPAEVRQIMDNFIRGGLTPEHVREREEGINAIRKEVEDYLHGLEKRAPERVKGKIRKLYTQIGLGTGALAVGLYLAISRRMKRNRLTPTQLANYEKGTRERPYIIKRSRTGKDVSLAYRNEDGSITVETTGYKYNGKRNLIRYVVRHYSQKGKMIFTERKV